MSDIIGYVTGNWATIVQLYLQIVGLASVIVSLTPSTRDNEILNNITGFIGKYIALNKSPKI